MTDDLRQWDEKEVAELRKVFYSQSYEIVEELQDAMLKLDADPGDEEVLKTVKRFIHTLKGDSNSIGLTSIGTLCHRMEDILSSLMNNAAGPGHDAVELLLTCADAIHSMLSQSEETPDVASPYELLARIDSFLGETAHEKPVAAGSSVLNEYQQLQIREAVKGGLHVYLVTAGFHADCAEKGLAALMIMQRLREIGEIIASSPDPESSEIDCATSIAITFISGRDAAVVRDTACVTGLTAQITVTEQSEDRHEESEATAPVSASPGTGPKTEILRVDATRVDRIMDLVGELIIGRSMIDQLTREILAGASPGDIAGRLMTANSYMERTVSDLQKGAMKMRMVPLRHVFRKFPKIVRDLSLEKGKKVRLEISGNETELDKTIVDALGEPLSHIVRNFIDHGIESPEERRSAGKHEEGRISFKAYHEASEIVIEAADDGRGIDTRKLKRKAIERALLTREDAEKMSDKEAMNLVYLSGLSTADSVSDTSGRGVGMDAVRSAVERMKGSIEIESKPGRGVLFRMRLPLTLAVIKALLFEVGNRTYAVPVAAISEVAKIAMDDLATVDGNKTLLLRDQIVSIISVEELFRVEGNGRNGKYVLILGAGSRRIGLMIDRLIRQQELVVKAIDQGHVDSDLVSGASILGNGRVVLILDAGSVLRKSVEEEKKRRLVSA